MVPKNVAVMDCQPPIEQLQKFRMHEGRFEVMIFYRWLVRVWTHRARHSTNQEGSAYKRWRIEVGCSIGTGQEGTTV